MGAQDVRQGHDGRGEVQVTGKVGMTDSVADVRRDVHEGTLDGYKVR